MGWTQEYSFPDLFDLFRKILSDEGFPKETEFPNKHIMNLAFHGLGWKERIKKIEKILIDEDPEYHTNQVYGWRVILSNGVTYKTVIKNRYVDKNSGNYGCDYYKWEKVKKRKSRKLKSEKSGE